MSDEIDKVLSKAPVLERALGRFLAFVLMLFALWVQRPRTGIVTRLAAVWAVIAAWVKIWT
jgi:hypothetical protein